MAAKDARKSRRFKMAFPKKVLGDPVMHRVSKNAGIVPNILKGRITGKGAWLEVELEGSAKGIEKALKLLGSEGVDITPLDGYPRA